MIKEKKYCDMFSKLGQKTLMDNIFTQNVCYRSTEAKMYLFILNH